MTVEALQMIIDGPLPSTFADWYDEQVVKRVLPAALAAAPPTATDSPFGPLQMHDVHWLAPGGRVLKTPRQVLADLRNPAGNHCWSLHGGSLTASVYAYVFGYADIKISIERGGTTSLLVGCLEEAAEAALGLAPARLRTGVTSAQEDLHDRWVIGWTGGPWRKPWDDDHDWVSDMWPSNRYRAGLAPAVAIGAARRIAGKVELELRPMTIRVGRDGLRYQGLANLRASLLELPPTSDRLRLHDLLILMISADQWEIESTVAWFKAIFGARSVSPTATYETGPSAYLEEMRMLAKSRQRDLLAAARALQRGGHQLLLRPRDKQMNTLIEWLDAGAPGRLPIAVGGVA